MCEKCGMPVHPLLMRKTRSNRYLPEDSQPHNEAITRQEGGLDRAYVRNPLEQ